MPDGFSEELKEVTYAVGAEYLYQDSFAMRLGYFHESPVKGARQFFLPWSRFQIQRSQSRCFVFIFSV
jgi:hypothetical protein